MRKDKVDYFYEFVKITEYISSSTKSLIDLLENYSSDNLINIIDDVHKTENDADKVVHRVRKYLVTDFLPPIDREDIAFLFHKVDNIEDGLDEIVKSFKIFCIDSIDGYHLDKYIELLSNASERLSIAFMCLNNFINNKTMIEEHIRLNKIEEEADRCFEFCMEELYKSEKDPIKVIKWTTIYNNFEYLFDTYEGVSDCIEDIILKNS